ncbi:hypothetical protein CFC21_085832 [Triticum aestivum]|uniref:Fatty acyl-CoA reductase n=2 Tax=Triticum aestivum TaxID=4565 RepID=A0A3B6PEA4_WHEAT|nr:hypothetical protein CFC21_085832 [Triticum aestivum]
MDTATVIECFRNKSILITGSTGFVGKMLVEKILRVQPDVKKLYLLVRSSLSQCWIPLKAFVDLEKKLFDVLRDDHRANFNSFIQAKISPLPGDIVHDNFALNSSTIERLSQEIDVIVSVAAFYEMVHRYDNALASNSLGVANMCQFANKCANLKMLLRVSTAFVVGEQEGLILEKPFNTGEKLRGYHFNIQSELKLVDSVKSKLRIQSSTDKLVKKTMKELGLKRARHFGWPNVYSLTKAKGEMLLGDLGRDLPVVIVRPSIITSTFQDPMPGWTEGTRTIDMLYVAYNDQKLPCFIADPIVLFDLIPGDMVINAMMVAMASHWDQQGTQVIYHVVSGNRNPLRGSVTVESMYQYFSENPRVTKDGKIVKNKRVLTFKIFANFHLYMIVRYKLPLEMLHAVNVFGGMLSQRYKKLSRGYSFLIPVAMLYVPYVFFKGRFDDTNMSKLWAGTAAGQNDDSLVSCDPACINWVLYLVNTHIPAVLEYAKNNNQMKQAGNSA